MSWLTGGALKGYRTYILSAVAIIVALANYEVGAADLSVTITAVLTALGLLTAAVH